MTAPYSNEFKEFNLIDLVLADQKDMSAVDRFSGFYERSQPSETKYRALIPLTRPQPGEQYAFLVDLDRCSGCKACVSACHSLNGLDDDEMWRSVGTILGEESPYLQTVTSSCHHCVDPACAAGCPVLAYEKDPVTGIVHHLDDQCIGCQYCVLKCPYDVPKYSKKKGIVRKCDLCSSRLAVGEAPACAQACPHDAIRVEIVNQDTVRAQARPQESRMITGAFPSSYTQPTTRYKSSKESPDRTRSACSDSLRLEQSHWPLVLMLVLTQMAAGLHLTGATLSLAGRTLPWITYTAAFCLFLGLNLSVLHLGRPLKAWRAFLGWRRSWMSREILLFSGYAGLATLLSFFPAYVPLSVATALVGLGGVVCSAMIYVDTQRPGWFAPRVFPDFLGDVALLGTTASALLCAWFAPAQMPVLIGTSVALGIGLFAWRFGILWAAKSNPLNPAHRGATIAFRLAPRVLAVSVLLFVSSIILSSAALQNVLNLSPVWMSIAFVATLLSQTLNRWLFFAATPSPRMPGAFSA